MDEKQLEQEYRKQKTQSAPDLWKKKKKRKFYGCALMVLQRQRQPFWSWQYRFLF